MENQTPEKENTQLAIKENKSKPPAVQQNLSEGLMADEVRVPIVMLIQDKNHLLLQDPKRYQLGMIVEMQNGEILSRFDETGSAYINFVPIHFKRLWVCKNPIEKSHRLFDKLLNPKETIWATENHNDPRIKEEYKIAVENEVNPRVTKYIQFLGYVEGYEMPVILSLGAGSRIVGENLLNRLIFGKSGPMAIEFWQRKFKLTSFQTPSRHGGNYWTYRFEKIAPPTDQELQIVKAWENSIARKNYKPDNDYFEDGGEDAAGDPTAPGAGAKKKDGEDWDE